MVKALNVDRVIRVSVNLQPLASARRNFGALLIAGASNVIDTDERIRSYTSIEGVASDFGINTPEYFAAELFFSQTPKPYTLYIGRYVNEAAPAMLKGAILPDADLELAGWQAITAGSFKVSINSSIKTITGLDFTEATNLNAVASIINAKLTGASCVFDGQRFVISTSSTGEAASIGFASSASSGTDVSAKMHITEDLALPLVAGMNAESPKEAAIALADKSGDWYGLIFAEPSLSVKDHLEVAAFIESSAKSRIYGVTATDTRTLDKPYTEDVAQKLKDLRHKRTCPVYSRNPYAIVSAFARAFTVNFNANRSTITLKFKQLPGVVAEGLSESQALTLEAKRCNVFAAYDNGKAIFQEGVMSGDAYFDEIHGLDWLQNAVQTEVWNLLYQSKTKTPQTDAGVNQIVTCIENVFGEAINNGLIAPGTWNADGFGQLERGQYLPKGYYLYAQPVDDQPQSEREQRKCPPIQCAVKLAGAIHSTDIIIDVNR